MNYLKRNKKINIKENKKKKKSFIMKRKEKKLTIYY